jgi:hypothetical protein
LLVAGLHACTLVNEEHSRNMRHTVSCSYIVNIFSKKLPPETHSTLWTSLTWNCYLKHTALFKHLQQETATWNTQHCLNIFNNKLPPETHSTIWISIRNCHLKHMAQSEHLQQGTANWNTQHTIWTSSTWNCYLKHTALFKHLQQETATWNTQHSPLLCGLLLDNFVTPNT